MRRTALSRDTPIAPLGFVLVHCSLPRSIEPTDCRSWVPQPVGQGDRAPTRFWLHIYRKVTFQMKITMTLLMLLGLFLPNTSAQQYTRWNLPEGAVARLGKGSVQKILYSPDGSRLAVQSSIGIWLYDTTTYQEVALLARHTNRYADVAFSPDGRTLASWGTDRTVLLWDTETGEQKETLAGHTSAVTSIAFSPDGRTIASGSHDKTVRLWDTKTGEHKGTLTGHTEDILIVEFSPDGTVFAAVGWDGVRLWDAITWEPKGPLTGWTPKLNDMAFSPDGKVFVVNQEGHVTFWSWDTETWEQKQDFIADTTHWIYDAAFSPDGTTLASGSYDKEVWLWDTETREVKKTLTTNTGEVYRVVFSPDGTMLAGVASWDGRVLLWDTETWELKETLTGQME